MNWNKIKLEPKHKDMIIEYQQKLIKADLDDKGELIALLDEVDGILREIIREYC